MKLSHILIATLVSSSVCISAQNQAKVKEPKSKTKSKTEKKAQKAKVCKAFSDSVTVVKENPHYCPACGRG